MTGQQKDRYPLGPRIGRLDTIGAVITELGRLYRQARRGEISSADASRLASILATMRQGMEASLLEQEIAELKAELDGRHTLSALPAIQIRRLS